MYSHDVGFFCFNRGDSVVKLLDTDVRVIDTVLVVSVVERKGKRKTTTAPLGMQLSFAEYPLALQLLGKFRRLRQTLCPFGAAPSRLLVLPGEDPRWITATAFQGWCRDMFALASVTPAVGCYYASHSLRKGTASAAHRAGVPVDIIRQIGDWSRLSDTVWKYIDATFQADDFTQPFWGWLARAGATHCLFVQHVTSS